MVYGGQRNCEKSEELCAGLTDGAQKMAAIRAYIVGAITYDYDLAATVQNGYLPAVDSVLAAGKGICFDYAAVTACMLRTQGIPTQLVIGWADTIYHAWNMVWLDGAWQRIDTTAEANRMNVKKYTEERIY
ncbi:MAG TPA: transglutaminase-like domain-containing protein [Candidatus Limiplasma sp.]|nr:transglutaminase-like domain-containing protein [Candidatus Limiplasma sp.]HPS82625.1 transglutaminase-like domain-containing protein [Candidatus Limiplasma sp.]